MNTSMNYKKKGFSLVEMLIYISILTVFTVFVVSSLLSMTKAYKHVKSAKDLNHAALVSMERMTRAIQNASSVNATESSFDTYNGKLSVVSGTTTSTFMLTDGVLYGQTNFVTDGPLTLPSVTVNKLQFTSITASSSRAIKVQLGISSGSGDAAISEEFYSTVLMRGSY
jgi:prepilin-type N-terminal cleavage/methylation domain-containing protein